jgi:general secretion pathway protein B
VSLILDALRKADSERERGAVPGLHAQSIAPPSLEPLARAVPWMWIMTGLAGALIIAAAAYLFSRTAAPSRTTLDKVAAAPASATTTTGTSAVDVPMPAAAPSPVPAPAAPPLIAAESQAAAKPAPWTQPVEHEVSKPAAVADPAGRRPEAAVARQEPKPDVRPQPAPEPQVPTREQLPEGLRSQLPQIAVGGSIYSPNAYSRSVIINGQIYHENDALTADLVLEQIKPKAAVFRFKGQRFEMPF